MVTNGSKTITQLLAEIERHERELEIERRVEERLAEERERERAERARQAEVSRCPVPECPPTDRQHLPSPTWPWPYQPGADRASWSLFPGSDRDQTGVRALRRWLRTDASRGLAAALLLDGMSQGE